jgi:hypothetical protein
VLAYWIRNLWIARFTTVELQNVNVFVAHRLVLIKCYSLQRGPNRPCVKSVPLLDLEYIFIRFQLNGSLKSHLRVCGNGGGEVGECVILL